MKLTRECASISNNKAGTRTRETPPYFVHLFAWPWVLWVLKASAVCHQHDDRRSALTCASVTSSL